MGALLDAVEAEVTSVAKCPVRLLLADPAVGEDLEAMLPQPKRYPGNAISRALAKQDPPVVIGGAAIQAHRAGRCSCRS